VTKLEGYPDQQER